LLIISCKKEAEHRISDHNVINRDAFIVNGRHHFNSLNELREYYERIALMVTDNQSGVSCDSILDQYEESLGFYSARKKLQSMADTRADQYDWLKDKIRLSILNEYYELEIGDFVYVYFSENQVYKIPIRNTQVLDKLRALDKGDDSKTIIEYLDNSVELISEKFDFTILKQDRGSASGCSYSQLYLEQVTHQCEPLTKDFIFELALSYTDGSGMQWLTYVDVAYETVVKN
jgi:hypothetical protein